MKNHTLILTIVAASVFIGESAYAQSTPTPTPILIGGECRSSSSNTELYGFCGAKGMVLEKLAGLPTEIVKRRVFIQITQGSKSGEVKLYERQNGGKFTVTTWSKGQTSALLADVDKTMFDNKGVNCVGEQVIAVLRDKLGEGSVTPDVDAPANPVAAFSHSIKNTEGDFVRTVMVILC